MFVVKRTSIGRYVSRCTPNVRLRGIINGSRRLALPTTTSRNVATSNTPMTRVQGKWHPIYNDWTSKPLWISGENALLSLDQRKFLEKPSQVGLQRVAGPPGSGKATTAALSVVRGLLCGVSPEKILVVTGSRAAAVRLADVIASAIQWAGIEGVEVVAVQNYGDFPFSTVVVMAEEDVFSFQEERSLLRSLSVSQEIAFSMKYPDTPLRDATAHQVEIMRNLRAGSPLKHRAYESYDTFLSARGFASSAKSMPALHTHLFTSGVELLVTVNAVQTHDLMIRTAQSNNSWIQHTEILLFSNPYELQTVSPLSKLMETSLWKPLENSPIPAILTRLHDADPWSTALPALPQLEMAKTPLVHLQCAGAVNESEAAVVAARHALEDSNDDVLIVADRPSTLMNLGQRLQAQGLDYWMDNAAHHPHSLLVWAILRLLLSESESLRPGAALTFAEFSEQLQKKHAKPQHKQKPQHIQQQEANQADTNETALIYRILTTGYGLQAYEPRDSSISTISFSATGLASFTYTPPKNPAEQAKIQPSRGPEYQFSTLIRHHIVRKRPLDNVLRAFIRGDECVLTRLKYITDKDFLASVALGMVEPQQQQQKQPKPTTKLHSPELVAIVSKFINAFDAAIKALDSASGEHFSAAALVREFIRSMDNIDSQTGTLKEVLQLLDFYEGLPPTVKPAAKGLSLASISVPGSPASDGATATPLSLDPAATYPNDTTPLPESAASETPSPTVTPENSTNSDEHANLTAKQTKLRELVRLLENSFIPAAIQETLPRIRLAQLDRMRPSSGSAGTVILVQNEGIHYISTGIPLSYNMSKASTYKEAFARAMCLKLISQATRKVIFTSSTADMRLALHSALPMPTIRFLDYFSDPSMAALRSKVPSLIRPLAKPLPSSSARQHVFSSVVSHSPPRGWSFTTIRSYLDCSLQFALRSLQYIPPVRRIPHFASGAALHDVVADMQQAKKKGHKQATPAEVKEKVKKSIKKLIIEQVKASKPEFTYQEAEVVAEIELVKEEQQQQIETLTIAAVKFQEKEAAAKVHAAKTEAKFEILLKNGTRLGGAWDRINIDKQTGEVSIIEYKTSLKRQNPLNLYLQTLIYALGYQRTHNKIPDHVVVEAINSQSSFRITYSEDNLKTAEALLMALTDHINQEEAFPAQPSRAVCDSCPYSNVCPSVLPQQAFDRPFVFREPRTNNKNGVKVNA